MPPTDAERRAWADAGLLDTDASEEPDRLALLEYLTARGATIEQMVEAHAIGNLPGVASDLVIERNAPTATVRDVAASADVPIQTVLRALLAAGVPAEPDTEVPAELTGFLDAFKEGAALMGDEAILAFIRVLGAAATNIAEGAVALFFTELGPGSVREGPNELARAQIAEAATTAFTRVPDVVAGLVQVAFERASHRVQVARPYQQGPAVTDPKWADGPAEVVALGFVDLVGSTAWAQSITLRKQNLALTRFESAAWSSAVLAGGRVVKMIGDEVFFAAPTSEAACRIAVEVCAAVGADHVLPPARGAVGIGPVTPREGDYFGPLVNLLARLVKVGGPGEVVATEAVAQDLDPASWTLTPLAPADVRGVDHPVPVFHVEHRGPGQ